MGKSKRIPVDDIQAMKKTLDALPDKNLGKTRSEAADMLLVNIRKAYEKGYTAKEIAGIMAKGNVSIPAPILRAKTLPPKPAPQKRTAKPKADAAPPKPVPASPAKKQENEPAYYTPDTPDTEL
jgi:hypothetical protein